MLDSTPLSIINFVQIKNQSIRLNHELVFNGDALLDEFLIQAYKHLGSAYPKFYKMDAMCKLGFLAAEYLFKNVTKEISSQFKKGIVLQNYSSSLVSDENYQQTIKDIASPALFVYTLPNIILGELSIRHNYKGENTFFVSNAFDAKQLVDYATILFENKVLEQCIIGSVEISKNNYDVIMCLVEHSNEGQMQFNETNLNSL